jgi:hypothetical protein
MYKCINNYIVSSKNISICKTKEEELKELNRFKSIVKRRNWKLNDILNSNIHYICIFSNISLLKYLYKQNVDLYIDYEEFSKNINVMLMSNHKEAIQLFHDLYFINLQKKEQKKIAFLVLDKILHTMSFHYFVNFYNIFDIKNYLKKEDFLELLSYKLKCNHFHFNNFISFLGKKVPHTLKIVLNDLKKIDNLNNISRDCFLYLNNSLVWDFYCIRQKEYKNNNFLKQIVLLKYKEDKEKFVSQYFF